MSGLFAFRSSVASKCTSSVMSSKSSEDRLSLMSSASKSIVVSISVEDFNPNCIAMSNKPLDTTLPADHNALDSCSKSEPQSLL